MSEQTPAALGSGRPAGWVSFGVHSTLDYCHYTGALEFSEEKNASGMPKWERHDGCRWMPEPAAALGASDRALDLGRCPTCRGKWPLYVGAYDRHGKTVRCGGCLRVPGECWCR